jgi:ribosome-associated toxin RatA of RatAB toxin-antitoxin module
VHSETSIWIAAPPRAVFPLVADLARWPERLPHYRYVRILSRRPEGTRAAMSAWRGPIPVFWEALQTPDAERLTVRFLHLRGITRGMEVLWTLSPERGGTRATIVHDLVLGWPVVGEFLADHVIAPQFIEPIAARTLRCFKAAAEEAAASNGAAELPAAAAGGGRS